MPDRAAWVLPPKRRNDSRAGRNGSAPQASATPVVARVDGIVSAPMLAGSTAEAQTQARITFPATVN